MPVSNEYRSKSASVVFPMNVPDVICARVVMPFINIDCLRLLFSDLEMAQMSFNWHKVGDIKPDKEFSTVSSDIDPKLVPASTRVNTADPTYIVVFLAENTVSQPCMDSSEISW